MERNVFKELTERFSQEADFDKKVELILDYKYNTLTNPQIQKLLDTLKEADVPRFIQALNKKIGE